MSICLNVGDFANRYIEEEVNIYVKVLACTKRINEQIQIIYTIHFYFVILQFYLLKYMYTAQRPGRVCKADIAVKLYYSCNIDVECFH